MCCCSCCSLLSRLYESIKGDQTPRPIFTGLKTTGQYNCMCSGRCKLSGSVVAGRLQVYAQAFQYATETGAPANQRLCMHACNAILFRYIACAVLLSASLQIQLPGTA